MIEKLNNVNLHLETILQKGAKVNNLIILFVGSLGGELARTLIDHQRLSAGRGFCVDLVLSEPVSAKHITNVLENSHPTHVLFDGQHPQAQDLMVGLSFGDNVTVKVLMSQVNWSDFLNLAR